MQKISLHNFESLIQVFTRVDNVILNTLNLSDGDLNTIDLYLFI